MLDRRPRSRLHRRAQRARGRRGLRSHARGPPTMTLMARPYGGTGLSLGELQDLPRRDRLAILAGTVALRRTELDELKRQLSEAESFLLQEMGDAGATVRDAGEWEIKLTQARRYTYDLECLSQLQAFLEPEQYEE